MKKKFLGRLLTMLLVAAMVFTLLPASAIAAAEWWGGDEYADDAATQATDDYKYNIFFLDCGRKYYSVDSIKQFIDNASAAGFNYIQLAVGNDGLRFLLNDMSLTVNGTTYESDAVKSAIHAGNEAYYNFVVDELTQSEMDTIIAYAKEKGMGVIPCVNTPGHMDAILSAANTLTGKNCSYNSSVRTIDVTNTTATAFTKALLQKYITYFAGKGCQLFNMGADEYANDKYTGGSMGFGNLQSTGNYSYYVTYVNEVAAMIKAAKMIPMAFNDGIYFNNNTWSGMFDTDIIICYWSSGWSGYSPMPAATLAGMGFKMVNTNGGYYWVLGKTDAQCSASKASGFNYKSFPGSTIDAPAGSMFCIWADYPGAETESSVISKTAATIAAFGATLPKVSTTPVEPGTDIVITPDGGTSGSTGSVIKPNAQIKLTANKEVYWTSSAPEVVELTSADDDVAAQAATYDVYAKSVYATAVGEGTAEILADDGSGNTATYSLTVSAQSTDVNYETIDLVVEGNAATVTQSGNVTNQIDTTGYDSNIATYATELKTQSGKDTIEVATEVSAGKSYFIRNTDGTKYLSSTAEWVDDIGSAAKWTCRDAGSGMYYLQLSTNSSTYVGRSWGNWAASSSRSSFSFENGNFTTTTTIFGSTYEHVLGTPVTKVPGSTITETQITFTPVYPGTTKVTIGNTEYTINVAKKTVTATIMLAEEVKTYSDRSKTNTVAVEKPAVVSAVLSNGTLTVTPKATGTTAVTTDYCDYTITVTEEDLNAVTPLTIEYWITNDRVTGTTSNLQAISINAADAGVNTPGGIDVTSRVDAIGTRAGRNQEYWQCRVLNTNNTNNYGDKTGAQTKKSGDDETTSGNAFTKVRYYDSAWQVFTDENQWVRVESYHQLVAYYLEVLNIANANNVNELKINAADWGVKGDGTGDWGYGPESSRASVSVQIVYEGGSTNPDGTTAAALKSKTIVYGFTTNTRGIGTLIFTGEQNYDIYKITAETGAMESSTSGNYVTVTKLTWNEDEETVWGDDEGNLTSKKVTISNVTSQLKTDAPFDNLMWAKNSYNSNNAILIRVYVKAEKTEDTLTVHYMDRNNNDTEFHYYNITVDENVTFDPGFALVKNTADETKNTLINNTVTNSSGQTQRAEIDLAKLKSIQAQYRYAKFICVDATRSANGKDVYLYYTFSNVEKFVIDFGLPVTILPKEINSRLGNNDVSLTSATIDTKAKYGTAEINADYSVTYTPNSSFAAQNNDSFALTFTGTVPKEDGTGTQSGSVSYIITILPASNVLYEENFLTKADGWTLDTTTSLAASTAQETQKAGDTTETTYNVFGYDNAYASKVGASGYYQASNLIAGKGLTDALTTEFYGNGFDLIGNCGTDTGRVFMLIENKDGGKGRIVDVDTRYNGETLYQVPLAHVELSDAHYTVKIYAGGLTATTTSSQSGSGNAAVYASGFAVNGYDADLNRVLAENGLTLADVEYTKISSVSPVSAVSAYSVAAYADTATTVDHQKGTHVEIDGFRVYRSTTDSVADNYPANEQNVKYVNILNAVTEFTAFVEGSGKDTAWTKADEYELKGGPQNEIYLRTSGTGNGSAVTFKTDVGTVLQISACAVENGKNAKLVINGTTYDIASNTEMYYTVTANENGIVTIKNTGDGMLALGNLKVKNGTTVQALSEEDYPAAIALLNETVTPAEPEQPTVFVPEHFSIRNYATPLFRHKLVTLRIDFSKDVSYVEIDGQKYYPSKFASWFGYYTVTFTDTIGRNDNYFYKVVFFDANGNPSETQSVYGN